MITLRIGFITLDSIVFGLAVIHCLLMDCILSRQLSFYFFIYLVLLIALIYRALHHDSVAYKYQVELSMLRQRLRELEGEDEDDDGETKARFTWPPSGYFSAN